MSLEEGVIVRLNSNNKQIREKVFVVDKVDGDLVVTIDSEGKKYLVNDYFLTIDYEHTYLSYLNQK